MLWTRSHLWAPPDQGTAVPSSAISTSPPAAGRSSWPTATMLASARRIKCSIVRVLWIQQVCISNKPPQTPVWPALERRRALAVSRAPPGPPCGECFLISLHTTDLKFQALVETFFPPRQQLRVPSSSKLVSGLKWGFRNRGVGEIHPLPSYKLICTKEKSSLTNADSQKA